MWYTIVSFPSTVPLLGHSFCTLVRQVIISSAEVSLNFPSHTGMSAALSALTVVASFSQLFAGYLEMSCIFQCVFFVLQGVMYLLSSKINMLNIEGCCVFPLVYYKQSPVVIPSAPLSGMASPHLDPLWRCLRSTRLLFPHTTAVPFCETPKETDTQQVAHLMSEMCKISENYMEK